MFDDSILGALARLLAPQAERSALGATRDNRITNRLVEQGKLPRNQAEIYPQIPARPMQRFEGYYPQDIAPPGEGDVPNFLQPAYRNPQMTMYGQFGGYQGPNTEIMPQIQGGYDSPFGVSGNIRRIR